MEQMDVITYNNISISITYLAFCSNKYAKNILFNNKLDIKKTSDQLSQLTNTQYFTKKLVQNGYSHHQIAEASNLCKSTIRKIECGLIKNLSHSKLRDLLIVYCRMICRLPIKQKNKSS